MSSDITLKEITATEITNFFLNDPALCYMGLSDNDMNSLYYDKEYIVSPNSNYMGVFDIDNNVMVGVFKYEAFSEVAVVGHLYVAHSSQKKGHNPAIWLAVQSYLINNYPKINKLIATVPDPCEHVKKAGEKLGFKFEGKVSKSCVWRTKIVDLLFYSMDLDRGK